MDRSIFGYLTSYVPTDRREAKEDYLTQLFAWLLSNVEGYVTQYIAFLCAHSKDSIEFPLPENTSSYTISTQETLSVGRIDLLIKVNHSIGFICEHKVHSELSKNQINKYMANSEQLGPEKFYSVLVTFSNTQHTQPTDVSITWNDVCEFTEHFASQYNSDESRDAFLLNQFITYLKENGMGKSDPISKEALLGYWPAINLEYELDCIFRQIESYDWTQNVLHLCDFSKAEYAPKCYGTRWGRLGIDFFTKWAPGLFAGVLLHTDNHGLLPVDINKGPDFVLFMESDYKKNDAETLNKRNLILSSKQYKKLSAKLSLNSGSFQYQQGIDKSPWRIIVLHKPLYDVLENAYTKEEQTQAVISAIEEGLRLMTE